MYHKGAYCIHLFLVYVNDIWKNTESTIRLCRGRLCDILKNSVQYDVKKLHIDLGRLEE